MKLVKEYCSIFSKIVFISNEHGTIMYDMLLAMHDCLKSLYIIVCEGPKVLLVCWLVLLQLQLLVYWFVILHWR